MKIILTMGDPNGIGIEVLVKAFQLDNIRNLDAEFEIAGNSKVLLNYIDKCKLDASIRDGKLIIDHKEINILDVCSDSEINLGENRRDAGKCAADSIEYAVKKTIEKKYDAVVTMPVSKEALYMAGWIFPGHTEMLADRCGVEKQVMILCTRKVRVALATVHTAISTVPGLINEELIEERLMVVNGSMINDHAISSPRIAVLGLNPHAGENGSMGQEEIDIISPAIKAANEIGIKAFGPFPSDGFFAHGEYKNYDAILAMYHDQGLIPLKMIANGAGINYTAGLPIVRTSVDHGTAFAIAGKDMADERSAAEAIEMAVIIAANRKN